jgi:uncharacterized protein (TIGR01244 family)
MRNRLRMLACCLFACAERASGQRMTGPRPSVTIPFPILLDTSGMFNAGAARVGDDLLITGQPTQKALRSLRSQGFTTIVNLRIPLEMDPSHLGFDEAALAKELGMTYVYLPMRGNAEFPFSPEALKAFDAAMKNADGKVLLHCAVAWRASHLYAAYLIKYRNVSVDTALAHTRAIALQDDVRMVGDKQPIELFLDRSMPEVGHPRPAADQTAPQRTLGFDVAGTPFDSLIIQGVKPGSDADKQGLRNGDRLVELNGTPAAAMTRSILRATSTGSDRVRIIVLRAGQRLEFKVLPYAVP